MNINLFLVIAALPYIGVTVYDTKMHRHDRQVPTTERWLHGGIIVFVTVFLVTAVLSVNNIAWVFLLLCLPLMVIDELGYHQNLHIKEKQVHYMAGVGFLFFIGCWLWMI